MHTKSKLRLELFGILVRHGVRPSVALAWAKSLARKFPKEALSGPYPYFYPGFLLAVERQVFKEFRSERGFGDDFFRMSPSTRKTYHTGFLWTHNTALATLYASLEADANDLAASLSRLSG